MKPRPRRPATPSRRTPAAAGARWWPPRSRMRIVEFDAIKDLMDDGYIVISTGGGGVPVIEKDDMLPWRAGRHRQGPFLAPSWPPTSKPTCWSSSRPWRRCASTSTQPEQQELNSMTVAEAREVHRGGPVRARLDAAEGRGLHRVRAAAFPEGKALITSLECAADGFEGQDGHGHHGLAVLPAAADARSVSPAAWGYPRAGRLCFRPARLRDFSFAKRIRPRSTSIGGVLMTEKTKEKSKKEAIYIFIHHFAHHARLHLL